MTLQVHPNLISLSDVAREFGGEGTISLSNYYTGGPNVPGGTLGYPFLTPTVIPSSGKIGIGNFHGATKELLLRFNTSTNWVCPEGITSITTLLVAGGGAGGVGAGDEGGGGGGAGGVLLVRDVAVVPGETYPIIIGAGGPRLYRSIEYSNCREVQASGDSSETYTKCDRYIYYRGTAATDTTAFGLSAVRGGTGGVPGLAVSDAKYSGSPGGKRGIFGGSGGGGMGNYGGVPGAPGVAGQGNAGGWGGEEGNSGGGGGARGGGGSSGGGAGLSFTFAKENIAVGGGGGAGTGWWQSVNYGGIGGGGYGGWSPSAGGVNTGGGGGGGRGDFSSIIGAPGGSGVAFILIGFKNF